MMRPENISKFEKCINTIKEFHEEYLDLFFNPDDRAFIGLEIMTWYEELTSVLESIDKLIESEKSTEEKDEQ